MKKAVCATWCDDCPRRAPKEPVKAEHPVWPFSFADLFLWPSLIAAGSWYATVNLWVGGVLAFLAALAIIRTVTGIVRSGIAGVRPALWQKLWSLAQSIWDSMVLASVAFVFMVAAIFFFALAEDWYDLPDFAQLSGFVAVILGCVVAPALVLVMYVRGMPEPVAVPRRTPTGVRWAGGLLATAFVNGLLAVGAYLIFLEWPLAGYIAGGFLAPVVLWSVWGTVLELLADYEIGPIRAIRLVSRGAAVLAESLLVGGSLTVIGCLLPVLARATNVAGAWQELANWSGVGLGSIAGSMIAFGWWWTSRPRMLRDETLETEVLSTPMEPSTEQTQSKPAVRYDDFRKKKSKKRRQRERQEQAKLAAVQAAKDLLKQPPAGVEVAAEEVPTPVRYRHKSE